MSPSSDSPNTWCMLHDMSRKPPVPSSDRPKGVTERIRGVGRGADVNYKALLIDDGDGSENVTWTRVFFKLCRVFFHFAENVKWRRISLELISWESHSSLEKERKIRPRLFMSSIKLETREIRLLHVIIMQWRLRNVQKSVLHVQSCCFALILYFFVLVVVAFVVAKAPFWKDAYAH